MAIVEGSCKIVIPAGMGVGFLTGAEPPIPSDEEIMASFPDWPQRASAFLARVCQEEGKSGFDVLTQQDLFRYGMKFIICEAKKMMG